MTPTPRPIRVAAMLAFLAGLAIYGWGAVHSPLLDADRMAERTYRQAVAAGAAVSAEDARLAERYWQRYPDIAADPYFGRAGPAGPRGARDHYDKHGRREGRIWGE
ncbi:MAG: hypothetical protein AB7G39_05240 [Alphaproteobacteria bacterium]